MTQKQSNSHRFSSYYVPTRKEAPAEADVESHKLLVRGGYVRMLARGIYSFLPLGWRAVRKIEKIVREEMNRAGALELHMPMIQPAELWEESGRWSFYGPELLRLKDRKEGNFCLGPTHEEVITDLVRGELSSYKQLPLNLYQIQTKFRDEARPRFGLMRGREFVMKDAYSFHIDKESALETYDVMKDAYTKICDRIGLDFRPVAADSGNIGGSYSHEFQVLAQTGEDEIATCSSCDYAANVETAKIKIVVPDVDGADKSDVASSKEIVDTPNVHTMEEVADFLKVDVAHCLKTLIVSVDDASIAVLMRGDHDLNEVKLKNVWNKYCAANDKPDTTILELAEEAVVKEVTGAPVGFAGPVDLPEDVVIVADYSIFEMPPAVCGANQKDKHFKDVVVGVDFKVDIWGDLRLAKEGDPCGECGAEFKIDRGIEVGHVFYLGTKYSEAMGATVLNEDGKPTPIEMGCYGFGVTRMLAAAIEQKGVDGTMVWPVAIAPFEVTLLTLQTNKEDVVAAGDKIYEALDAAGVEVLYDDRDLRAGNKFADADLIGSPIQINIGGRGVSKGVVEVKDRRSGEMTEVKIDDVANYICDLIRD